MRWSPDHEHCCQIARKPRNHLPLSRSSWLLPFASG
jgi:hypothetical protein